MAEKMAAAVVDEKVDGGSAVANGNLDDEGAPHEEVRRRGSFLSVSCKCRESKYRNL